RAVDEANGEGGGFAGVVVVEDEERGTQAGGDDIADLGGGHFGGDGAGGVQRNQALVGGGVARGFRLARTGELEKLRDSQHGDGEPEREIDRGEHCIGGGN